MAMDTNVCQNNAAGGAGTQDYVRIVNTDLGKHCFKNGSGYNCCSKKCCGTALVLTILSTLITQTLDNIVSNMCLAIIVAQGNVVGRRLFSRISAHC
jgi:hypothetical protein